MHAQSVARHGLSLRQLGWGLGAALLLLPAIAMFFSGRMNWGIEDFATLALMIGAAGLAAEAGVRLIRKPRHRLVLAGAIALAFLLVWAELAIGVLPN
jgi:hypothetical protein